MGGGGTESPAGCLGRDSAGQKAGGGGKRGRGVKFRLSEKLSGVRSNVDVS